MRPRFWSEPTVMAARRRQMGELLHSFIPSITFLFHFHFLYFKIHFLLLLLVMAARHRQMRGTPSYLPSLFLFYFVDFHFHWSWQWGVDKTGVLLHSSQTFYKLRTEISQDLIQSDKRFTKTRWIKVKFDTSKAMCTTRCNEATKIHI